MIEHSHPFERRMAVERAIANDGDGGEAYFRSLGMPEDLIRKTIERRAKKLGRTVPSEGVPSFENVADLL
jgi:hypothetical protein